MRLAINIFKAALAVSYLAIAACGGEGSSDSQSAPNSEATAHASLKAAAVPSTAHVNGTSIPSATQIIDSSGNVWTVSGGVIYENGALAGYSNAVKLLLYVNNTVYQENSAGGWWSWNGSTWASSSDPRHVPSPTGTTVPAATQIIDSSGNVWAVSGGVVYENGALAGYSAEVTLLLYDNNVIYQENAAGGWWSWNGSTWVSSSDPRGVPVNGACGTTNGMAVKTAPVANLCSAGTPSTVSGTGPWTWSCGGSHGGTTASCSASVVTPVVVSSPNGTTIPSATQIIDSSGNVWTVTGGVIHENGALAGYSNAVALLLYDNNIIYQENSAGGWWSWNGSTWVSSSDPRGTPVSGTTTPTISGSPPSADFAGQAYSFVPTTTNPGGGTLGFSITNKPAWANFSTVTGALTGTPSSAQVGAYSNILISVSNGKASAALVAFSITVTTGSATVFWTAPTQNTNGTTLTDLAGYTIYYGSSPGALTQTIQVANPTATSYQVGDLSSGTYYFAVAAYTTAGTQSAQSAVGSKTIP
jgi:Putative Ig domain